MADTNCKFSGVTLPNHSTPICPEGRMGSHFIMRRINEDDLKKKNFPKPEAICFSCFKMLQQAHELRHSSLENSHVYAGVRAVESFGRISAGNGEGMILRDGFCSREVCTNRLPPTDIKAIRFDGEALPICSKCTHPATIAAVRYSDMRMYPGPIADVLITARLEARRRQERMAKLADPEATARAEEQRRAEEQQRIEEQRRAEEDRQRAEEQRRAEEERKQREELIRQDERFAYIIDCFPLQPAPAPIPPPKRSAADLVVVASLEDRRRGIRRTA